jgi:hypothetical protein
MVLAGGVEAADGTHSRYESLPVVVDQVGVCLSSYTGEQGTFTCRLFGQDLAAGGGTLREQLDHLLHARRQRDVLGVDDQSSGLSRIVGRGLMAFAERAILLEHATAPWRMGHGPAVPFELTCLTGPDGVTLVRSSIELLRRLLLDQERWLYVPSQPSDLELLTLAQGLEAREYVIIETADRKLKALLSTGSCDPRCRRDLLNFLAEAGHDVVRGAYRASELSPPYLFYAHRNRMHEAALIALADSSLLGFRGFPALIDLADRTCAAVFSGRSLNAQMDAALARSGDAAYRWLGERHTRWWMQ